MSAFGLVSRSFTVVSILAALSACSSTDTKGALDLGASSPSSEAAQTQAAVIEGACPKIFLRDGTAFHDVYARGAKPMPDGSTDQAKLVYRAAISDTTRQCRLSGNGLVITVQAAGRLIKGQAGAATTGTVKLPIRVVATDGASVLYSELTQFDVALPTSGPTTQFVFTKSDVTIPGGAGGTTNIYVGFDNGPAPKKKN